MISLQMLNLCAASFSLKAKSIQFLRVLVSVCFLQFFLAKLYWTVPNFDSPIYTIVIQLGTYEKLEWLILHTISI